MPPRKLPPDDELIEMYQEGMSAQEIADKVGVSSGPVVASRLRKLGVIRTHTETWNLPGRHPSLATKEWLEQKYVTEGLGMPEIARILGKKDPKSILYWMRKYGIPTRPRGSDTRQHFKKGQRNAFAGRKHTPEAIEKIRQATLQRGGVPYLKNGVHHIKGKRGNVVWNWKGGVTPERQEFYRSEEWKQVANLVWRRDSATCQRCRLKHNQRLKKFHIHHIVSFAVKELRATPSNLTLLCHDCHMWVHSSENVNKEFIREFDHAV